MNGEKLRELRKESGKTLRQISIESGITHQQILNIESGETKDPRIDTLMKLAQAIGCEVSDFLDG